MLRHNGKRIFGTSRRYSVIMANGSSGLAEDGNATALPLIFTSEILAAVGAPIALENVVAIIILSRCRKLAFQIKALALNLAVTDCLAGAFMCFPSELDFELIGCRYKKFFVAVLLVTSMSTVTAFNVDRSCAFYFNMRYQNYISKRKFHIACLTFWIIGFFLAYLLFFEKDSPLGITCRLLRDPPRQTVNFVGQYFIVSIVLSNFLLYTYMVVYLKKRMVKVKTVVWVSDETGVKAVEVKQYIDEQTKVCLKLSVITGSFILMCTPYLITQSLADAQVGEKIHRSLRLWSGILMFLNSALNPVLYVWRFKEARYHFKRLACFWSRAKLTRLAQKNDAYFASYEIPIV